MAAISSPAASKSGQRFLRDESDGAPTGRETEGEGEEWGGETATGSFTAMEGD
jgi:hypothetical protein